MSDASVVLRLAGPIQSWGTSSQFNRRETDAHPSKSGVIGLLAAAQGRRRSDPIEDLVRLRLGLRIDQPGSLMRDYHTVSTLDGSPLPSAAADRRGRQRPTSPKKFTHVTQRFYLQDAVFVAVVSGPQPLIRSLADAVVRPAFPLALGRRACVPTQPLLLAGPHDKLWPGDAGNVLATVAWQAAVHTRERAARSGATVRLPISLDDDMGEDVLHDVPVSFAPSHRGMRSRRVRHDWVTLPVSADGAVARAAGGNDTPPVAHDPFSLLGW